MVEKKNKLCNKMRIIRMLTRLGSLLVFGLAFLTLWDIYNRMAVREDENPDSPLHVVQVRANRVPQHTKVDGAKKKTMEEMDREKSAAIDFMKEQAEVQRNRKRGLQDACANVPPNSDGIPEYTKKHVYVVDQFKIAYCFVPKVGCSNWKRILMVLNGERDSVDGLTSNEVHTLAQMKFLAQYDVDEQERIVKDYSWFFVVREPFKRALSVYRNKFENYEYFLSNERFHRFAKTIIKRYRKNASPEAIATGANATWPEFVDYLTHAPLREKMEKDWHFSDHWREMYKICAPCTIDYDLIGKLESIDTDAKYLLKKWGVDDKVSYLSSLTSRPTNSSSSSTMDRYFGQLNKDQVTALWDLFKLDYDLFNYTRPSVVP